MRGMIRSIVDVARTLLFHVTDKVACSFSSRGRSEILVVRLDAIGDFVLWLDAAKELRQIFPGRRIVLLANAVWADLAKRLPYWDEVWAVQVDRMITSPMYRWMLLRRVHEQGFATAVQPTFSRVFLTGDALIRASGAPQRIGSAGDCSNQFQWKKRISDRWYTRLLPARAQLQCEISRNAEFIGHLCGAEFRPVVPSLPQVAQLPDSLQLGYPYLVLFPGASWSGRQWPPEFFAQVANELHAATGWTPVLCGSAADVNFCSIVAAKSSVQVVNLAGCSTLAELVELVRGARLLVGNETSAVHIAAAVGTPSVCILGGGHFGRFLPYPDDIPGTSPRAVFARMDCFGCNWQCYQPHEQGRAVPCISGISPVSVVAAALEAVEATDERRFAPTAEHERALSATPPCDKKTVATVRPDQQTDFEECRKCSGRQSTVSGGD